MRREVLGSLRLLACTGALLAGTGAALAAQERERYGARSPGAALALSALGTAAPIWLGVASEGPTEVVKVGLFASGLVLGPALGWVYAGEAGRGMAHAGIRAAVLGAAVGGAVVICSAGDCSLGIFGPSGAELAPAVMLGLAGVVVTTLLAVRDIVRVEERVRARNKRLAAVSVQPAFFPESRTAGLLVT